MLVSVPVNDTDLADYAYIPAVNMYENIICLLPFRYRKRGPMVTAHFTRQHGKTSNTYNFTRKSFWGTQWQLCTTALT